MISDVRFNRREPNAPTAGLRRGFRPRKQKGAPRSRKVPQTMGMRSQPFTHTTCLSVCTTSTRSLCACITASMSL